MRGLIHFTWVVIAWSVLVAGFHAYLGLVDHPDVPDLLEMPIYWLILALPFVSLGLFLWWAGILRSAVSRRSGRSKVIVWLSFLSFLLVLPISALVAWFVFGPKYCA